MTKYKRINIKKHRDIKGNHYHGIMDDIDDNYVSIGFTSTNKKGKNATNYKLENSPFLDGHKSYMRRQAIVDKKYRYFGNYTGYLSDKDYEQAKKYSIRAKDKYLHKKK